MRPNRANSKSQNISILQKRTKKQVINLTRNTISLQILHFHGLNKVVFSYDMLNSDPSPVRLVYGEIIGDFFTAF